MWFQDVANAEFGQQKGSAQLDHWGCGIWRHILLSGENWSIKFGWLAQSGRLLLIGDSLLLALIASVVSCMEFTKCWHLEWIGVIFTLWLVHSSKPSTISCPRWDAELSKWQSTKIKDFTRWPMFSLSWLDERAAVICSLLFCSIQLPDCSPAPRHQWDDNPLSE
jgi:hypothetical protein